MILHAEIMDFTTTTSSTGDAAPRQSVLSNKITNVLSTSYADLDIRDALDILDQRHFQNTSAARRQLRLDVQKEVIDCNGEIIKEFGQVAEVSCLMMILDHVRLLPYSREGKST